jgi:hypothetical protein
MIEYPQEPLCGYCHEKIAAHPCPGKVGKLRNDHEALKMSVEGVVKHGEKLQAELSAALLQINELKDALHLAYDWMGRETQDAYELVHLNQYKDRVQAALMDKSLKRVGP